MSPPVKDTSPPPVEVPYAYVETRPRKELPAFSICITLLVPYVWGPSTTGLVSPSLTPGARYTMASAENPIEASVWGSVI